LRVSPLKTAAIAVAVGVALGVATQLVVHLPNPVGLLGTLGGPWLGTAFAVGVAARSRRTAPWAGAASMAAAVIAYYVARKMMNPALPGGFTVRGEAIPYILVGLVSGAAMAVLGALWRAGGIRWKVLSPGLLAGALGAEVVVLSVQSWRGSDLLLAVAQGGAAVVIALRLPRHGLSRFAALAIGAASAAVVAGVILAADLPLRVFR
jgi:hypothetical protein